MKISSTIHILSTITIIIIGAPITADGLPSVKEQLTLTSQEETWLVDQTEKYNMGLPLDTALTQAQTALLNNYMLGFYNENKKFSQVIENLIKVNNSRLNQEAYSQFILNETMKMELSKTEAVKFLELTKTLNDQKTLSTEDQTFIKRLIENHIPKRPQVALLPYFPSIIKYVNTHSELFSNEELDSLQNTVFAGIGISSTEKKLLEQLTESRFANPILTLEQVIVLRKISYLGELQLVSVINPKNLVNLQKIMNQNSTRFNSKMLDEFNKSVKKDPRVIAYKKEQRNAEINSRKAMESKENSAKHPSQKNIPSSPSKRPGVVSPRNN